MFNEHAVSDMDGEEDSIFLVLVSLVKSVMVFDRVKETPKSRKNLVVELS